MANSGLLLTPSVDLISEDIELSLRSLQSLLEDLKKDGEGKKGKIKKSKRRENKIYDEDGIKSLFYGDDDDVYEDDEDEDEEEYPTADREDKEKLREAAKSAPKKKQEENDERTYMKRLSYEVANASQKIASTIFENNIRYPTDRAFHSIVIENKSHTNVYNSLLNVAMSHNLQVEARTYEGWGGGGVYIESIKGVKNGQDGYFWEYIVNGKIPDVSVDKFQLHSGDLIEWRRLKKAEIKC